MASHLSPNPYPYFASLAVILTLQATVADTMARALYRVAGIVGGVIVGMMIGHWLRPGAVAVALALLVGLAVSTALRLNPAITSQVGVSALLVLVAQNSREYAVYRLLESALGGVVAIIVNAVIVPPNEILQAERRIAELADLLARSLSNLSRGARESAGDQLRGLAKEIDRGISNARQALRSAEASGKLNPLARKRGARLRQLSTAMGELEKVAIQVRGVARGLTDLEAGSEQRDADLQVALQDTAECIAAFGRAVPSPSDGAFRFVELAVAQARASHSRCLSHLREATTLTELRDLGAILTDLDRILTEVTVDLRTDSGQAAVGSPAPPRETPEHTSTSHAAVIPLPELQSPGVSGRFGDAPPEPMT